MADWHKSRVHNMFFFIKKHLARYLMSRVDMQHFKAVKHRIQCGNIDSDGKTIDTPTKINLPLKLHQQRMVYEMMNKETSQYRFSSGLNMGVISDKVGSGKSLVMLSLIAARPLLDTCISNTMKHSHSRSLRTTGYYSQRVQHDFVGFTIVPTRDFKTNLIVVPHGIFNQWKAYLRTHTELSFMEFGHIRNFREFTLDQIDNVDVVLVKSTKFDLLMETIYREYPHTVRDDYILPKQIQIFRELLFSLNTVDMVLYHDIYGEFVQHMQWIQDFIQDVSIKSIHNIIPRLESNERFAALFKYIMGVEVDTLKSIIYYANPTTLCQAFEKLLGKYQRYLLNQQDQIQQCLVKIADAQINMSTLATSTDACKITSAIENISVSLPNINTIHSFRFQEDVKNKVLASQIWLKQLNRAARRFKSQYDVDVLTTFVKENPNSVFCMRTYTGPVFQRVIVDEVASVKLSSTCCRRRFAIGKFTWFISSSIEECLYPEGRYVKGKWVSGIPRQSFAHDAFVENIHHSHHEFINLMFHKTQDECVDKSFNLPDPVVQVVSCLTPKALAILSGLDIPKVIHALNAGDMESAIRLAGCSERSESDICTQMLGKYLDEIAKLQHRLEKHETKVRQHQNHMQGKADNAKRVSSSELEIALGQIEKIKIKLQQQRHRSDSLKERITNLAMKKCPVCMDDIMESPALVPCCNHAFCFQCIASALSVKSRCPLCREEIAIQQLTVCNEKCNDGTATDILLPTKIDATINLIKNVSRGKFLIFSQYGNSFRELERRLMTESISYRQLKGNGNQISKTIDMYRSGKCSVLLLNAAFYGTGLNLEMTTDIIICHRMSRDMELQVIGRGQRLGRTEPLRVHYLCYDTEYKDPPGSQISNN